MSLLDDLRKQNTQSSGTLLDEIRFEKQNTQQSSRFGDLPTLNRNTESIQAPDQAVKNLSLGQRFVRSTGNLIDGIVPFGDPIKGGLVKDLDNNWLNETFAPAQTTKQKVLDGINEFGGNIIPITGAYKAADKALDASKGIKNLFNPPTKGVNYLEEAQKGLLTGTAWGVQNEIGKATQGQSEGLVPALQNIALEGTIGTIADPAIMAVGKGIKRGAQKLWNSPQIQEQAFLDIGGNKPTNQPDRLPTYPYNVVNKTPQPTQESIDEIASLNQTYSQLENDFVQDSLSEFDDVMYRMSEAEDLWKQSKDARKELNRINQTFDRNSINIPEGFEEEWGTRLPSHLKAAKGKGVRDIYQMADELGFPSDPQGVESMLDYIDSLRASANVRKSELMPSDAITPKQYQYLENDVRKMFQNTPDAQGIQSVIKNLNDPGDYNSFRSKIDRTPKKKKDFSSTYLKLRTQFIDDTAPLEKLEKNIRGEIASAENSLYKQARLFRGSPEKAHNFVRTRIQPIIKSVEDAGYTYEDLGDYALAKHAQDVNSQGINSGFTDNEIASVIQKLGSPEMEQARQQLVDVSTQLLKVLEDGQVISPGTTQMLRNKWPNYMPLFRSFDDDKIEFGAGLSKSFANVQNPIKKLEGSDRDVIDPIESMVKNTFKTFNAADRNSVALQLSNLAKEDTAGNFIRRVEGDTSRKNVVSVMENGEKVKYEVPAEVYKTITNLNQEASNLLIKILQKPASMLRAGATLDPVFSIRNPMRDILQAFVVSNSRFNPFVDFPIGLFNAIFKGKKVKIGGKEYTLGKYYQDFIEANGGFGNIVSMDRDLHRKAIKQGLNQKSNVFVNIINPKQWLEMLRAIADASETATKVGEFRAAKKKKGVSTEEAAYRARDIMDFSRAGTSIREANKVVAFLNANIQGKSKLIRATVQNPFKVMTKGAIGVTLPTVAFYAATQLYSNDKQKQAIDDAPQWLKETFWLVPIPGTDLVGRIPKPFDLVLFSNPVERALDYTVKNDKQAFDGWVRELAAGQALPVMMTGLAPFVEGMSNYSFFMQGPIIPQREQNLNFNDQYDINTTGTARFIAEQINKVTGGKGALKNFGSPRIVDNTIQGLTAGLGSYVTNAVDSIFFNDHYDKPEKPAKDFLTEKTPLKGFLVNEMSTGQSMSNLYDLREELRKDKGSAKQNQLPFEEQAKLDFVEDATSAIGDISTQMRKIENDPNLSGEEKRQRLEELNEQRNAIARDAWERIKEG